MAEHISLVNKSRLDSCIMLLKSNNILNTERVEQVMKAASVKKFLSPKMYTKAAIILSELEKNITENSSALYVGLYSWYIVLCTAQMMNEKGKIVIVNNQKNVHMKYLENLKKSSFNETLEVNMILEEDQNESELGSFDIIVVLEKNIEQDYVATNLKVGGRALLTTKVDSAFEMHVIDKSENETTVAKMIPLVEKGQHIEFKETIKLQNEKSKNKMKIANEKSQGGNASMIQIQQMDILKCPVCFHQLKPPTLICLKGHVTCSTCKIHPKCLICGSEISSIINKTFDDILYNLTYSCKGKKHGCQVEKKFKDIVSHESTCKYCDEVECPSCSNQIFSEMYEKHIQLHDFKSFTTFPLLFHANTSKWIKYCLVFFRGVESDSYFDCFIKCNGKKLYIVVRLASDSKSVEDYTVTITLKHGLNEIKTVTKPALFKVRGESLWSTANIAVEQKTCLELLKNAKVDINCVIDKVVKENVEPVQVLE